jgi:hypothetical protein
MPHFYERNIVEIRNEYTTFLVNIMTPFLYEGMKSLYDYSIKTDLDLKEAGKQDPKISSPGVLKLFQRCLKDVPNLNNHQIDVETTRIKEGSKSSDFFDDLIRSTIKSNIVLLTFTTSKKRSSLVESKYHEKVNSRDFVHKCYIECARTLYDAPELFWHQYPTIEIKRNQREICELVGKAIRTAIRKLLPIKLMLEEYLTNDYYQSDDENEGKYKIHDEHYMNVRELINREKEKERDNENRQNNNTSYSRGGENSTSRYNTDDTSKSASETNILDNDGGDDEENGYEDYDDNNKLVKDVFMGHRDSSMADDTNDFSRETSYEEKHRVNNNFVEEKPIERPYNSMEQAEIPAAIDDNDLGNQSSMIKAAKQGSTRTLKQMIESQRGDQSGGNREQENVVLVKPDTVHEKRDNYFSRYLL